MATTAERLRDARAKTDSALECGRADRGASPVLVAVVIEFAHKAEKAANSDDERTAVIELEQAGDTNASPDSTAARIARRLENAVPSSGNRFIGSYATVARLLDELRRLNDDLKVPTPRAWGIDPARYEELLPVMASQALASGSPANNPRVPTSEEIIDLYRRVYG